MGNIKLIFSNSLFSIFIFLGFLPAINIGYAFPLQYFFVPFWFIYVIINSKTKIERNISYVFILLILLTTYVFLNSLIIGSIKLNRLFLGVDFLPFFFRTITFMGVFYFVYNSNSITSESFQKLFLVFGVLAMSISFIQWIPSPVSDYFSTIYAYKETTIEFATRSTLWYKRVQGFGFHPTATGGVGAFFFVLAFYTYFIQKKHRFISLLLIILSVVSTAIFMQARMGTLTIIFALVIIGLFSIHQSKDILKLILTILVLFLIVILILGITNIQDSMYYKQFFHRWTTLVEQSKAGGNRIGQVLYALGQMDTPIDYLFGISRPFQQHGDHGRTMLIEVEPFYIFVIYGLVGIFLAYLPFLPLYLHIKSKIRNQLIEKLNTLQILNLVTRVTLITYLFFSLAYYFYRENYVPLIPWIFWATVLALNFKNKS